jgi:hypothetical protein
VVLKNQEGKSTFPHPNYKGYRKFTPYQNQVNINDLSQTTTSVKPKLVTVKPRVNNYTVEQSTKIVHSTAPDDVKNITATARTNCSVHSKFTPDDLSQTATSVKAKLFMSACIIIVLLLVVLCGISINLYFLIPVSILQT